MSEESGGAAIEVKLCESKHCAGRKKRKNAPAAFCEACDMKGWARHQEEKRKRRSDGLHIEWLANEVEAAMRLEGRDLKDRLVAIERYLRKRSLEIQKA